MLNIGKRIKNLRKLRNLTQMQLAIRNCVTQTTISRYENEKILLSIQALEKISKSLDCSLNDLINDVDRELDM